MMFRIENIIFSHGAFILTLFTALALVIYFQNQPERQILVVITQTVYYILWGIGHHYIEDREHHHIYAEYILLGIIAFLITLIVFFPRL